MWIYDKPPNVKDLQNHLLYAYSVMEKFDDLRWVPLQPEFIEYPNAQFLMIGEAQDSLGKAASAQGGKQSHEIEPGEELEKMEHENEDRVHALEGKCMGLSKTLNLHQLIGIAPR